MCRYLPGEVMKKVRHDFDNRWHTTDWWRAGPFMRTSTPTLIQMRPTTSAREANNTKHNTHSLHPHPHQSTPAPTRGRRYELLARATSPPTAVRISGVVDDAPRATALLATCEVATARAGSWIAATGLAAAQPPALAPRAPRLPSARKGN